MLNQLIQSALQTGCLSVESEGLIRQLITFSSRSPADQQALQQLWEAMQIGQIQREARCRIEPLQELLDTAIATRDCIQRSTREEATPPKL